MTQFANKRFSVSQSGRSPDNCSHGWIVKGRCWYCGTVPELRCRHTGNPCGTDTWPVGLVCPCRPCQEWLTPSPPEPSE